MGGGNCRGCKGRLGAWRGGGAGGAREGWAPGGRGVADWAPGDPALPMQRMATYGSTERAEAVQLLATTLLGMGGESAQLAQRVSQQLASNDWMSTQSTAWGLLAMGEYTARNGRATALNFEWSAGGRRGQVASSVDKVVWNGEWDNPTSGQLSVVNKTQGTLYVRAVASGVASGSGVAAASNGLEGKVRYVDGNGRPMSADSLAQGTDFVVETTVRNVTKEPLADLMLTEPVASGWEIRPDAGAESAAVSYRDVRDDRVDSFISALEAGATVTVRTRVSATYAGRYTLPAVRCSAMYDGAVSGNTASGRAVVY